MTYQPKRSRISMVEQIGQKFALSKRRSARCSSAASERRRHVCVMRRTVRLRRRLLLPSLLAQFAREQIPQLLSGMR